MPTLGQTLRAAREQKKVTASQAAAATRIKVQHIEALEGDDFSQIAAPMYAKGFIRLYADYLGLDPAPMIREYTDRHAPKERAPLLPDNFPPRPGDSLPAVGVDWTKVAAGLRRLARPAGIVAGVIVLVSVVSWGARKAGQRLTERKPEPPRPAREEKIGVVNEPPSPYLNVTLPSEDKP